jgi:hypothetical protein
MRRRKLRNYLVPAQKYRRAVRIDQEKCATPVAVCKTSAVMRWEQTQ